MGGTDYNSTNCQKNLLPSFFGGGPIVAKEVKHKEVEKAV